ncbi:MAG TPA: hypothetical protein VF210_20285 [Pseudomonadales bacterium]
MQHTFTNEAQSEGVWVTGSNEVFCRWHWDPNARRLVVEAGDVTCAWSTPDLDLSGESGMYIDLPETAKDVGRLIHQQR